MQLTLEPWTDADLEVLRRSNTPGMTQYLGGPESDEALLSRHAEYLAGDETVRMFRVEVDRAAAGYAGWWEQEHEGAPAFEIGCVILPEWQGRGAASAALTEIVRRAIDDGDGRPIVGYANIGNEASSALCRRVGFTLEGTGVFPGEDGGADVTVNVWVIRP